MRSSHAPNDRATDEMTQARTPDPMRPELPPLYHPLTGIAVIQILALLALRDDAYSKSTRITTEFPLITAARIDSRPQYAAWICRDTRGAYKPIYSYIDQ